MSDWTAKNVAQLCGIQKASKPHKLRWCFSVSPPVTKIRESRLFSTTDWFWGQSQQQQPLSQKKKKNCWAWWQTSLTLANPDAEAGGSLWEQGQTGLYRETLSQNTNVLQINSHRLTHITYKINKYLNINPTAMTSSESKLNEIPEWELK